MHGVGAPFVAAAFDAFSLPPYIPVEEQCGMFQFPAECYDLNSLKTKDVRVDLQCQIRPFQPFRFQIRRNSLG